MAERISSPGPSEERKQRQRFVEDREFALDPVAPSTPVGEVTVWHRKKFTEVVSGGDDTAEDEYYLTTQLPNGDVYGIELTKLRSG